MIPDTEWLLAYLALGAFAGFLAGLFGVGGGLVLVPILLFLFDAQHISPEFTMHMALGTSMATIVFTSMASMRKHHQHGAVLWPLVAHITPGILLGSVLGAMSASVIPARGLAIFFTLFVFLVAGQILLDRSPLPSRQIPRLNGLSLFGIFTGWISSLVSIGGGSVIVPYLVWCNVPLRQAIGSSAAIGFPVALGGTLGYTLSGLYPLALPAPNLGYVYLPALCWVAFASVVTAPLGAIVVHRMKVNQVRKLFAILLLILAVKMLLKVISGQ